MTRFEKKIDQRKVRENVAREKCGKRGNGWQAREKSREQSIGNLIKELV